MLRIERGVWVPMTSGATAVVADLARARPVDKDRQFSVPLRHRVSACFNHAVTVEGPTWKVALVRSAGWVRVRIRGVRRIGLFPGVVGAVIVGIGLFVLGFVVIRAHAGGSANFIDVLQASLRLLPAVSGPLALVVTYRRQNDIEQNRFVERFGAAAAQLGHPDPAVRIAGVYAMAGVADQSTTFLRRQQCIDVLCGYLRLPYDPARGSSHHTEFVSATKRVPSPAATRPIEQQDTQHRKIRQNDREVRQTIIRVIASHLDDHV